MYSRFTDLQKTDIIAQYWRGKPVTKICEEYAVSKSTVYAWVRPYLVKKEAEAVGRQVFIQKEMINLQNKMCRLNTIIEILGKAECLRNSPVVIDLFSRKVLAYRVSPCCSAKMITSTFKTAYAERGYPEGLIVHSDQGTQYTSSAFRGLLSSYGVTQSFSYPGRPVDNAVAESFFANLKREELYRHDY